jgi:UDP-glucose 4-epimerase
MTRSPRELPARCLVTGGAGFIGSTLVDLLIDSGHDVVVVDNESATMNDVFYWNDRALNHKVDIVDYRSMRPLFDDIDYVFHLAAESRLQPAILNPIEAVEKNVLGTTVVLQCAKEASVARLVYSSTSSGYGLNPPPNHEGQPDDCLNPYSLSKIFGEGLCRLFNDLYGLKTISLRYFNVYGERSPTAGQYAPVVGIFLEQYRAGCSLTVVGDGTQKRDFIHVRDVAAANVLAATAPIADRWFGQFFNVASGANIGILDLARLISDDVRFLDPRVGEAETTLGSIEKISQVIGWGPTIDVRQWIADAKREIDGRNATQCHTGLSNSIGENC